MTPKTVILLIAYEDYQPIEYGVTRDVLINAGVNVITASNQSGTATATDNSSTPVDSTIDEINPATCDGLFLIGGSGGLPNLDTPQVHKLLQQIMSLKKPYGAICISARILAHANVLGGKRATGWNGDQKLEDIFKAHAVIYVDEPVVTDGNIVTATGPEAAETFGQAILKVLP